jgi:hypothetical protein
MGNRKAESFRKYKAEQGVEYKSLSLEVGCTEVGCHEVGFMKQIVSQRDDSYEAVFSLSPGLPYATRCMSQ